MASAAQIDRPVSVTSTPGVMGGVPCIDGTRVPAETVRQCLLAGDTEAELLADYDYLPVGTVRAVEQWADDNGFECPAS